MQIPLKKKIKTKHWEKRQVTCSFSNVKLYRKQPSAPSSDLLGLSMDFPSPGCAAVQSHPAVSPLGSKWWLLLSLPLWFPKTNPQGLAGGVQKFLLRMKTKILLNFKDVPFIFLKGELNFGNLGLKKENLGAKMGNLGSESRIWGSKGKFVMQKGSLDPKKKKKLCPKIQNLGLKRGKFLGTEL